MSTIVVPFDFEEGHTLPILRLLKLLKDRGHRVCCLGPPKVQELVRRENIEFIPIRVQEEGFEGFWWLLLRGVLDEIITQINPELALVRSLYRTEGLVIHYRYRLPIVYLSIFFQMGKQSGRLRISVN
jgi:UDP:flavonoid glycosyltransferase YjiC (YdhE family)